MSVVFSFRTSLTRSKCHNISEKHILRVASSVMLRRVALVRPDVSEEPSAFFIRVTRIGELGTALLVTLMKKALGSSETSVFTRATWRNILEHAILHSHSRVNLKSYKDISVCEISADLLNSIIYSLMTLITNFRTLFDVLIVMLCSICLLENYGMLNMSPFM
jgi:hypothetical protein